MRPQNSAIALTIRGVLAPLRQALSVRLTLGLLLAVSIPLVVYAQAPTPGQNVNMVSGTKWPGGDPFLRQQNEPSIAVSTRNPQHLLAGANDYRTVDLPLVDQLPINQLNGDAWLGVFKSFDGGQRWQSTLLPGFPQDQSTFGASSPMKGFGAASDPTVRAGTNGMFYYSGIALNRNTNIGGLFLARFIDLNNKENGDAAQSNYPAPTTDPIRYLNTVEIDHGNAGQFIDKPWIAVDIPRSGAGTCTITAPQDNNVTTVLPPFPAGNIYIAYAMFVGGAINVRSKINFSKSSDCGATWTKPIMISQTFDINQGTQIAVDPETGYVYVAWRVFSGSGSDPDAIVITKSTDGGNTFTKAVPIRTLTVYTGSAGPAMFDQNTNATEFRDQTMPTLAVDDSGIAGVPGHVYAAWAERGVQKPDGDARIQISTSSDGITWSTPTPVDNNTLIDDSGNYINGGRGHQLMPAMTFIGGKLLIVYYDMRLDHTLGVFTPNNPFAPDPGKGQFFEETRPFVGNSGALDMVSTVFTPFIDDADPPLAQRRHTIDVMVAQVTPSNGVLGTFSTARLSRYDFGLPGSGDVILGTGQLEQLKLNPPNLPMFAGGTVPFMGDYVDVAGQMFVPCAPVSSTCPAGWTFNNPTPSSAAAAIAPTKPPAGSPIYFGTWTTNQDVIPPADGKSWNVYTAPVPPGTISVFNGQPIPGTCTTGYEGDRNQNIYESRITQGLYVSSPQNSKPLSTTLQRAFVILVQNSTNSQKYFQLSIANQPPGSFNISGTTPGGYASFKQALPNQPLPLTLPTPVTTALATIPAHSGATRTVFVLSSSQTASITVNVNETDAGGNILGSGLSSFIVLNADGTVPSLIDPDASSNPTITGTEIYTPGITHPTITTPGITHQSVQTPGITHPGVETPGITHQGIPNQSVQSAVANTSLANSSIPGSSPLADATFSITNIGNTTGGYIVKLAGANSTVPVQLAVTQVYTTQTASNCALSPQQQDVTNVNVTTPGITHTDQFSMPGITHPAPTDATILLAPGDSAFITMRGQTDLATMANIVNQITPVVVPQAVNTNSTGSVPIIVGLPPVSSGLTVTTTSLPQALIGSQYAAPLQASGGVGNVTWALTQGTLLPLGLFLNGSTGLISGTPTAGAVATIFTVQATDSAANVASRQLGIDIIAATLGGTVITVTNTADGGSGSLRQAITTANASSSSPVAITFSIGSGVQTIMPSSALPALTNATILDATTQPGYAGTPIIELNGSSAGTSNGLHISAGNSTVRGLVINRFSGDGILLDTNGGDVVQGSYIGTDVTGTLAFPNTGNGIQIIDIANNVVGGTATLPGNVISGNGGEGLRIDGALATGNLIQGNYIGTNASGSAAVGNTASGVYIRRAPSNSVIGNTVSGNTGFAGITICGNTLFCGGGDNFGPGTPGNNAAGNVVQGNLVGTNSAGTTALGNSQAGVSIDGAPNTLVGGTTTTMHNVISFSGTNDVQIFSTGANGNKIQGNTIQGTIANSDVGISVAAGTGNTLSGNLISGHAGLGIDTPPAGLNSNPPGGANNFPVITSAQFATGTTTISGTLNSTANATFTIEFFSNVSCNTSGYGEGATFLGSTSVMTDASGDATFTGAVVGPALGNVITATATDASGTTSEFSLCFSPPVVIGTLMPTQGVHKAHSIDVRGLTDWTLNGVHHNAQRQSIGSPISAFVGARIYDISGRSSLRRTPMLPVGSNQRVG